MVLSSGFRVQGLGFRVTRAQTPAIATAPALAAAAAVDVDACARATAALSFLAVDPRRRRRAEHRLDGDSLPDGQRTQGYLRNRGAGISATDE